MKLKPTSTLPESRPYASELLGHGLDAWAGATLRRGLLRIHNDETGPAATEELVDAFGEDSEGLTVFATDWLARHYAAGVTPEGPVVVRADISTGELDAITTAGEFITLISSDRKAEDFFNPDQFKTFCRNNRLLGLNFDDCASYKQPPFLGGDPSVNNMELTDVSVHWALFGQMYQQVKDLPPGTPISEINAD